MVLPRIFLIRLAMYLALSALLGLSPASIKMEYPLGKTMSWESAWPTLKM